MKTAYIGNSYHKNRLFLALDCFAFWCTYFRIPIIVFLFFLVSVFIEKKLAGAWSFLGVPYPRWFQAFISLMFCSCLGEALYNWLWRQWYNSKYWNRAGVWYRSHKASLLCLRITRLSAPRRLRMLTQWAIVSVRNDDLNLETISTLIRKWRDEISRRSILEESNRRQRKTWVRTQRNSDPLQLDLFSKDDKSC